MNNCCSECGKEEEEGAVKLKACKSCMHAKYCNAACQKKHWATHKIPCKLRAAELRDEALFKDPPPKEDCPICFLPMPVRLLSCITLPPATISSVPIYDFAKENVELAKEFTEQYYTCCGKTIREGCEHSCRESGNDDKCPFCNSNRGGKTVEDAIKDIRKRVEANDAASIYLLADHYYQGLNGFQQDQAKAIEHYVRAAELGCSKAHKNLAIVHQGGDMKKAKFHFEAAAMAGHEGARCNLGVMEYNSGNIEQAVKHWAIAASAGEYDAMHEMRTFLEQGFVSRESIDSTLTAYNNSCAEMRSEARDARIHAMIENILL